LALLSKTTAVCCFAQCLLSLSDLNNLWKNNIKMTPTTMRAARYYGKEDVRIETTPRPQLAPGQILIKPSHVGICGTDLHEYIAGPT
jgi:hypothetical protein